MHYKLGIKLSVIFFILFIEILFFTIMFFNVLDKQGYQTLELEQEMKELDLIKSLQLDLLKIVMPANDYLIPGGDENELENFEKQSVELEAFFNRLDEWEFHETQERELLDRIKKRYFQIKEISLLIFSLPNARGSIKAGQLMEEIDAIADVAITEAERFHSAIHHEIEEYKRKLEEAKNFLNRIMLSALFFNGFFCIWCFFYFKRWIYQPIFSLHEAAQELGKGDFDKKVEIKAKDEIGQLCEAFDNMRVDLKESKEQLVKSKTRLEEWSQTLEKKVRDRTSQLSKSNSKLKDEVINRKQAQELIDRKQKNLESIFDATSVGMLLLGENMRVRRVNDKIREMTKKEDYLEIINRLPGEALNCINNEYDESGCGNSQRCSECLMRKTVESVLETEESIHGVETELVIKVNDSEVKIWVHINVDHLIIDDNKYVIVSISDISEIKQVEEELEKAKDAAEKANLAKGQFLANMSHEIRTPMNAITGFTEILAEEKLTEQQRYYVNIIKDSGKNLLALVNNILDFSKVEAGQIEIEIVDCSLGLLIGSVESLMRPMARKKGLDFEFKLASGLPAQIRTDPTRLRQCLINLIDNALKFTEQGHVYVNVSLEEIDGEPYIRFDIEDTGIGISAEQQQIIFESFMQADGAVTRKYGGTGLGLAITKQLADALGGELSIESESGKGSVFSFLTPARVDVKSYPFLDMHVLKDMIIEEQEDLEKVRFTGRILVAEDSLPSQALVKLRLEKLGFSVTIVNNGKEAVDKALSQPFEMIFMDIHMPEMDGFEATRILREKGVKTPIIALTANVMKDCDKKCFSVDCNAYLSKPFEQKDLLTVIRKYISFNDEVSNQRVDSIKSQVDELKQLCTDGVSSEDQSVNEEHPEKIIDWISVKRICGEEEVIKEIGKAFLEDGPITLESISNAIKSDNVVDIGLYAHKLKGAAATIGANKLSEYAYHLECAGEEKDMSGTQLLFDIVQKEFEKIKSFLSKADWIEIAKRQVNTEETKSYL